MNNNPNRNRNADRVGPADSAAFNSSVPIRPARPDATAIRIAGDRFGEIHDLAVDQFNDDGMSGICPDPIEPGALMSIGFASVQRMGRHGVAVHCQPCDGGYRVNFRFDRMVA